MMMCSNLPGSLLKPTLALMLLLRAVRSQYADYCGGLVSWTSAKLDYRVVLRIRNVPSRRLYVFNPVPTHKDLRRLVSGKIREELIIANWPVIGRAPSPDCRVLLQLS
jgi:hypothetical protein